jgi:RHS repeat-associated protein
MSLRIKRPEGFLEENPLFYANMSGTVYFDAFESRNGDHIGPLAVQPQKMVRAPPSAPQFAPVLPVSYNPKSVHQPLNSEGVFSHTAFTYDGDGKRVKSVLTTNLSTTTTYFVGTHYEVTGSEITKYYYAGSQRIAMRKNGVLNYILGDHLGSTSLVTDANGTVVSEMRYKAWGEVRHESGSTPTKYQYTGQYSDSYINLLWYNSRHYDPELGRFTSPDTIAPLASQGAFLFV